MRMKYPVVLLITLLLFRLSGLAIACCEGDPPGNPDCYTCEDGVWVLKDWADCGQDSDCGDPACWDCVDCDCECDITVNSVSSDDYACVGCNVTFTANVSGSCSCVDWSGGGDPATANDTCIFITHWDSPGVKTVTAGPDCGDSAKQKQVTVVKVDKIEYNDPDTGWTYIQDSPDCALYVRKETTVTFKAIPEPSDASWPSGKPIWGGSSGASGTGETTDVIFNELSSTLSDYKTEEVALSFDTDPWSVTAGQAGGLEWTKLDGVGALSNAGNDGTADYDAEHVSGVVTVRITIKSGPSKGKFESYGKDIILPSGTRMTRVSGNVWHIQYSASAGIALYYWLDPTHVSFSNLTFGEDSCPATGATGIYITAPPGNHAQSGPVDIGDGNITTGCRVQAEDQVGSLRNPWGSGGTYTWSIPTQYIDNTSTRNTFGSNQNHVPVLQANGDATMNKGGQSGSAALNDVTSGY